METYMTKRTLRLALALGIAATFSMGATAAPGKMAALDLNGDTFVDQTEFPGTRVPMRRRFLENVAGRTRP